MSEKKKKLGVEVILALIRMEEIFFFNPFHFCLISFSWRMVVLQCCVGFFCITT